MTVSLPLRLSLACALAGVALSGCGGERAPVRPHSVLLVTLDTTRADVLSGDAASRELAPNVARLAEGGVRFPRAYTVAPLTLPAHASLLTGLVPPRHGLRDNGCAALPDSAETLAEALAARGFETAAFVSALVLDRGFGLDQGFARYDQPELVPRANGPAELERSAAETAGAAAEWLAARSGERPFFLWVHLYDAHLPYAPAAEALERAGGDAYRGEIAALDDAVGTLLDALHEGGHDDDTLVVLTADHGESLGEHGEPTHGALCYEATLRVPLLFRFPGAQPEPGPAHLASLVDLYPTILARLGEKPSPGLDGIDLFAATAPPERGIYFESYSGFLNYGWSPLAGWLDPRGKYLHSSAPEFYAELQDPGEHHDLSHSHPRECELARTALAELLARPALPRAQAPDGELAAALGALGYARGVDRESDLPSPLAPTELPSPRERARELAPLLAAHALFEGGRHAECLALVSPLTKENPRHLLALDLEGLCLMQAREFGSAEDLWLRRLALAEASDARLNLGLCRLERGDLGGAMRELEIAQRESPDEPAIRAAIERARAP